MEWPEGWLKAVAASDFTECERADFYLDTGCARRCNHCLWPPGDLRNFTRMMSPRLVQLLVEWLTAEGSQFLGATLLGGEAFLNPHAVEITKLIASTRRPIGGYLDVGLVTAGVRKTQELIKGDDELIDIFRDQGYISISLESLDEKINDGIRGRGAYRDAIAMVKLCQRLKIPFGINVTVSRLNCENLEELFDWAERAGAFRVLVHWFTPTGNGRLKMSREQLLYSGWARVIWQCQRYQPKNPEGFAVQCQMGYAYEEIPLDDPGWCAIRAKANLQIYPPDSVDSLECRASSCPMLPEFSLDGGGYAFGPGGMREIISLPWGEGIPENARVARDCGGCPLAWRFTGVAGDAYKDVNDARMVCVLRHVPEGAVL